MITLGSVTRTSLGFVAINAGSKILRFVSIVVIARYLGSAGFGYYSLVLAIVEVMRAIGEFGLDNILVRKLSDRGTRDGDSLRAVLHLKFVLTVLVTAVGLGAIEIADPANSGVWLSVALLSVGSVAYSVSNSIRASFQAQMRVHELVVPLTLMNVAYVVIVVVLSFEKFGIIFFFLAQAIVELALLSYIWSKARLKRSLHLETMGLYVQLLKDSLPLAYTTCLVVIYSRVSVFFISTMANLQSVGNYSASYKVSDAMILVFSAVVAGLFPVFGSHADDLAGLRRMAEKSGRKIFLFSMFAAMCVSLFSSFVMRALFSGDYGPAAKTLSCLALWIPLASVNGLMTILIIVRGQQSKIAVIATINVAVNVGANAILVGLYADTGAALAAVLTELINYGMQLWVLKQTLGINIPVFIPFSGVIAYVATALLVSAFTGIVPGLIASVAVLLFVVAMLVTREMNKNDIIDMLSH